MNSYRRNAQTCVSALLAGGYADHFVPCREQSKKPCDEAWPQRTYTPADFQPEDNIGLKMGRYADADFDCREAVKLASHFLPPTSATFGHRSKPLSHQLYEPSAGFPSITIKDPVPNAEGKRKTLVELRCLTEKGAIGKQTIVPPSLHEETGEAIEWFFPHGNKNGAIPCPTKVDGAELQRRFKELAAAVVLARHWPPPKGGRHDACLALAGVFYSAGVDEETAVKRITAIITSAPTSDAERIRAVEANVKDTYKAAAAGDSVTGVPTLRKLIDDRAVEFFLEHSGLKEHLGSARKQQGETQEQAPRRITPLGFPPDREPPKPLSRDAYHGVAGRFVDLVAPSSEGSRAALLIQFLDASGMYLGRNHGYYQVEATRHYSNLFVALVGKTGKGRKGTSWDRTCQPFRALVNDEEFARQHITSGLASGEGVIWSVRDPVYGWNRKDQVRELIDPGLEDKRILFVEPEFAKILQKAGREGSTLSATLREAFDSGDLKNLTTRGTALYATGAHIALVTHITKNEVLRLLTTTEAANGFGNRFLWVWTERSQFLPLGGEVDPEVIRTVAAFLETAAQQCAGDTRRYFDDEAEAEWCRRYEALSAERTGLLGAITARGEALVVRLSLLYSQLDGEVQIRLPHLRAALEVWRYCEESARFIFGELLGDETADAILDLLRMAGTSGATRTEIHKLFGRNKPNAEIDRALRFLWSEKRVGGQKEEFETGRPTERWFAL